MPGTVLDIKCSVGQQVAEGDTLVILEAMKMENEIVAPSAGTVASIPATKGASVNSGDVLVTLA
jgi:biotin carboxyl carrier protein